MCILLILLSSLILFLICLRRYKQQKLNKKHNEAYLDPAMDNYQEVVRYNGNRAHIDDGHHEQKAQVGRRLPGHPPVENETDGVIYTVSNSVVPDTGISWMWDRQFVNSFLNKIILWIKCLYNIDFFLISKYWLVKECQK